MELLVHLLGDLDQPFTIRIVRALEYPVNKFLQVRQRNADGALWVGDEVRFLDGDRAGAVGGT